MTQLTPNSWTAMLPRGDQWDALFGFAPIAIVGWLAFVLIAGVMLKSIARLPPSVVEWCSGRFTGPRQFGALALGLLALILIVDGSSFWNGFFRQDDFSFLAVAREGHSISQQMIMYHNDHLYLLFRLQVSALLSVAGPTADEACLAGWFNLVSLFAHASVLWAGAWLLQEAGAKRAAIMSAALITWAWPGWAEFTTGYYAIGVYVQVLALGLAGSSATLRYLRTGHRRWQLGAIGLATIAVGLNISGLWAFVAQALAVICFRWPAWRDRRGLSHLVSALSLFIVSTLVLMVGLRHDRSAREYVQNPTGSTVDSQFAHMGRQPIAVTGLTLLSAPGGSLLSLATPPYLQFGARKIADRPVLQSAMTGLQLIPVVALLVWFLRRKAHPPRAEVRFPMFAFMVVLVLAAMVILARPDYAAASPVFLWLPKYQVSLWVWAVLGLAFLIERFLVSRPKPEVAILKGLSLTIMLSVAFTLFHASFEKAVEPGPVSYISQGRLAHLAAAKIRRADYREVMAILKNHQHAQKSDAIQLPPWANWKNAFTLKYPLLEWSGDTGVSGVTYLFADLPFARPESNLRVEWAPSPKFDRSSGPSERLASFFNP